MVPLKQHLAEDGSAAADASEPHDPVDSAARGGFWEGVRRTALVVVSSAALGGIAIALWNRKTLNEMRRQQEERDAE